MVRRMTARIRRAAAARVAIEFTATDAHLNTTDVLADLDWRGEPQDGSSRREG